MGLQLVEMSGVVATGNKIRRQAHGPQGRDSLGSRPKHDMLPLLRNRHKAALQRQASEKAR